MVAGDMPRIWCTPAPDLSRYSGIRSVICQSGRPAVSQALPVREGRQARERAVGGMGAGSMLSPSR
jgi:hypothetical protein